MWTSSPPRAGVSSMPIPPSPSCQPVRQTMFTGLYPHRSGSMGFFPVKPEVRTLNEQLRDAGYLISRFGKGKHLQPSEKFCSEVGDDTISRRPSKLAEVTRMVLRKAREQGRPFFHNVNCYDPHRPFIGMKGSDDLAEGEPPSRYIKTEEITEVPGFLEDLPAIPNLDGRSFLPALKSEKMTGWDQVFTVYNAAFGNNWLPMRCMRTRDRFAAAFAHRDSKELVPAVLEKMKQEYDGKKP